MNLKHLWLGALIAAGFAHAGNQATVYYYTPYKAWSTVNMHYQPNGGTWTTVPGVAMTSACTNWVVKTVDIGTATGLQAVFNNGQNAWDNFNNQSGANYSLGTGIIQVKNGTFTANAANPCPAPDTIAPSVPVGLAGSNVTATSATVSWTASTDNVAVAGYDVYRNNVLVGSTATTSYTDTSLSPNTTYSYTIKAKDAVPNVSAASAVLTVTTGNAVTATIHYKRSDNNYTNWCLHLWGTGLGTGVATTWTAPRCFEGTDSYGKFTTFTLTNPAVAVNFIVHQGDTKDVTVDRSFMPSVSSQIWLKQGDATVYTSNPDGGPDVIAPTVPGTPVPVTTGCSVSLTWTASTDAVGVTAYDIYRNGVLLKSVATNSATDSTLVANTSYSYTIKARDLAGNISAASAAASVTTGSCTAPDVTPPTVPGTPTFSANACAVTLGWAASTDLVGVTAYDVYRNNALAASVATNSYSYTATAGASDSFYIKARDAASNVSAASATTVVAPSSCTVAPGFRLGVMYTPTQSTFSIWSPDSANVQLSLENTTYAMSKIADVDGYTNVYSVVVPGDLHLKKYKFLINGIAVRDPYGVMVDASTTSATPDNIVMDLGQTALTNGWAARPALVQREDAIIYEVHVRDFTIDASSGVDADKRGKYAGMTQTGTTLNGAGVLKTGIDHLKELGVTHVQLMPVYDFGTCSPLMTADPNNPVPDPNPYPSPLCYNWGYDPVNFNVPEERYASNQADAVARVREFKNMVNEFHKNGIRVIMDVVYNHTYNKNVFKDITSKYYTLTDLSGTGNSTDVKQPMVARMIRDSLEYWANEYNIDGFRFDLIGIFDTSVVGDWGRYLNQKFPDRNLLVYGEPWNGYATDPNEADRVRMGSVGTIVDAHVGVFNGKYRDALRGDGDKADNVGFVFNAGDYWGTGQWAGNGAALGPISVGMYGSPRYTNAGGKLANAWDPMFALDPEQSINYVDAHDNYCLNDKVDAWANANGQGSNVTYKDRIQNFALGSVLVSQGIPFMHGGSEMKRTKGGDKNSYRSPDSVNKYNWNWKSSNAAMLSMTQKMIALRKAHPGFRMTSWQQIRDNVKSDQQSKSLVVTTINAAANGDSWSKIVVIQNSGGDTSVSLPAGNWTVELEDNNPNTVARTVSGSVVAKGTALTILRQ